MVDFWKRLRSHEKSSLPRVFWLRRSSQALPKRLPLLWDEPLVFAEKLRQPRQAVRTVVRP